MATARDSLVRIQAGATARAGAKAKAEPVAYAQNARKEELGVIWRWLQKYILRTKTATWLISVL